MEVKERERKNVMYEKELIHEHQLSLQFQTTTTHTHDPNLISLQLIRQKTT